MNKILFFSAFISLSRMAMAAGDHTHEAHETASTPSGYCAVVEKWDGPVEVLKPNRKEIFHLKENMTLPCGSWVASGTGRISLKHVSGVQVRVASRSFVEMSAKDQGEVTLYRGALFLTPLSGATDFSVMTANAKVKIQTGTSVVIYNGETQKTQLVALEGSSLIHNRFHPDKGVTVKAGEVTDLDLSLMRIIPSVPKAIASSSLNPLLEEFALNPKEKSQFASQVHNRSHRQWASVVRIQDLNTQGGNRMPASSYKRHPSMDPEFGVPANEKRKVMDELKALQSD